ncbi:MAG: translation initiation factor IF-2, partial [Phycisphaerales bacterium JB038]
MAKAKRVFQIAKELGITSKDILRKCEAEGLDNITNHMSTVTVGLEETLRQWFGESEEGHAATAVETAPKVKVERRAKRRAVAKRRTKTEEPETTADTAQAPTEEAPAEPTPVATIAAPAEAPPSVDEPTEAAEVSVEEPPAPSADGDLPPAAPVVEAPTETAEPVEETPPVAEPVAPAATAEPAEGIPLATEAVAAAEEIQTEVLAEGEEEDAGPAGVKNVPRRPEEIAPAGPQLEATKPAKLRGPKVVRIEQPEVIRAPRRRPNGPGGPGGPGGGPMQPDTMPPSDRGGGPRHSRTKRRGAPSGGGGGGGGGGGRRGGQSSGQQGKWREQDLRERQARLSGAGGYFRKRRREAKRQEGGGERPQTAAQTGGEVKIQAPFTIKDLSAATGVKAADIIKKLFLQGVVTNVNSGIDVEKAQEIMMDWDIELIAEERKSAAEQVEESFEQREVVDSRSRAPVVTILGHVDHGKTSLLDRIRHTHVAEGEAGGITQATSAFRVPVTAGDSEKTITFLDTPGHQAFTAMRARGAQMTDIIVLVVAADDGVMPQTVESINHAKAAEVPIIVALNKIDKAEATEDNIQRILGQLAEHGLNPTEWGGDTEVIKTSAVQNTGIQDLLDTIDLQAEILELTADFGGPARGSVVESKFEEGRGPTANLLVQEGRLRLGDFIVAGRGYGRVRDITNDRGERIDEVGPATPVQISGIDALPDAGDKFYIVDSLKKAQQAAEQRRGQEREMELSRPKVTLDNLFTQLQEGEVKEMLVVIKADAQGSVDVVRDVVEKIGGDEVRVRVLHAAVGGVNESDIILAEASQAIILGFNVIASSSARQLAEQ